MAAHRVIDKAVASYFEEMGVPAKYTSVMLSTNASDMVWLSSEDIHKDLDGLIAEYAEKCRDACLRSTTPGNGVYDRPRPASGAGNEPTDDANVDCMSQRLKELQDERRQRAIARLLQEK